MQDTDIQPTKQITWADAPACFLGKDGLYYRKLDKHPHLQKFQRYRTEEDASRDDPSNPANPNGLWREVVKWLDALAQMPEQEKQQPVSKPIPQTGFAALIAGVLSEKKRAEQETKEQAHTAEKESNDSTAEESGDSSPEHEWLIPLPIETHLLPVLPVSPDMIPEPLRDWLTDIAYRMKCPLDFVASAAVVMLSALIGTRLAIKPQTRNDWTVISNLWGAVVGGPSAMKTPSIAEVYKPLTRLALAARTKFENELTVYEVEVAEYEAQKKAYQSQAAKRHKGEKVDNLIPYPEAPKKPREWRCMVNDVTIEKLAELMKENPDGLLLLRDELIGLLASWERSGHEQDRAFHLEAWGGNGSITTDRIARGTIHVEFLCESLFGGIQPAKLLPYLQAATGYENDGFVQRLQVAVYPDPAPWHYTDEYPNKAARDRAFRLIQAVVDTDFKAIGYEADDYERFPYTRFTPDAQEVFKQWLIELQTLTLENETGLLQEHFAKYRSLMPSLALIFHVVNYTDNPTPVTGTEKHFVSVEATRMAVRWCEYLQSHARRIYGLLETVSVEGAKALLAQIKRGKLPDGFKVREVVKKGWTSLTTPAAVESAVAELITRHYLREELPAPTAGRPEAIRYFINPKFYRET